MSQAEGPLRERYVEIDLHKYITIVAKRRKAVAGIFLASLAITGAATFFMPRIYDVSMIIEPPVLSIEDNGNIMYLDTVQNIAAKISEKAFHMKIMKAMNLHSSNIKNIKLQIIQPRNSNIIKIVSEQSKSRVPLYTKIFSQLFIELSKEYSYAIDAKRSEIEKQASVVSNNIAVQNNEIILREEKLKIFESRETELLDEIREIRSNTDQLFKKREGLLNKGTPSDGISSLLYSNTIQQDIAYLNQLNNQLAFLKTDKEALAKQIKNLRESINNLQVEIEKLNLKKSYIRNLRLVEEPEVLLPPKPKRLQYMAVAALLSLLLGISYAFFAEYRQRMT